MWLGFPHLTERRTDLANWHKVPVIFELYPCALSSDVIVLT